MPFVSILIVLKIVVTLVLVALPFLVLPVERLNKATGVSASSTTFYRLYGVAVLALLIGYAGAFPLLRQGTFPWAVVFMGIVSNTGATFVLIKGGSLACKRGFVMTYGAIALALIFCAAFPQIAMQPLL
ncbi:MAG: hypothetical protein ABJD13_03295 [Paracoccaceae bacterium]